MEFRILGPLEVADESGPIRVTAAKHRALLAFLILHPDEVVSADALVDALWGERAPVSARKLLHVYVSQLRKALGESVLLTRSPGYVLAVEASQLDSARFERLLAEGRGALRDGNAQLARTVLARALALWRGSALADVAYESFAQAEASRLEELRLTALEERIAADLTLGRHTELTGELQALVAEHPLRERLRGQLMLALYRGGRQVESLEAYADARRTLVDELGLEPSRELRELHQAILNQDVALEPALLKRPASASLPAPPTPLIGRERELADVARLLAQPDVRLVTITGPGGIGKTRLALEAGARARGDFANDVVFVELAALADPALVPSRIAEALRIEEQPGAPLLETIANALRAKELLLVLDNLEQVLGAAPAFADLLAAAPRLKVLATSRVRLRLSGEHVYPTPPLALPGSRQLGDVAAISSSPSVALLTERAQAVSPSFAVNAGNVSAVAEICTRLEGVPLAIELAAARIRTLSPAALLERLGRRLPLLTEGAWDLPARQQTLRATLDWSYELLDDSHRRLFTRLAVFLGGCTLESAEAVCGADDVLDGISALLDSSLLALDPSSAESRYRMLETVREYALERLDADDEGASVHQRHAQAFLALAERAEAQLVGAEQAAWHERLEAEHDNLRAALVCVRESDQPELELRLAAALGRFWYVRGHLSEGRAALEGALARPATTPRHELRAKALRTASAIAVIQGEYANAQALAEQGLALYRLVHDRPGVVRSLSNLGAIFLAEGEVEKAVSALDESVALSRDLQEPRLAALALNNRGDVALTQGDYDAAAALFAESLALLREAGDTANVARSLFNLGAAELERGNTPEALQLLRESVSLSESIGDKEDVAWCLVGLAAVATRSGDPARGAAILGAAAALLEGMGALMKPFERGLQERTLAAIHAELDQATVESAWARGQALPPEEAVALAVTEPTRA